MTLFCRVLLILAASTALAAALTPILCNLDECPVPLCADPVRPDGGCCDTCDNSTCRFRGCVHFGAFGPQWYPDPCTLCGCFDGEEVCSEIFCDIPECFGFPLKTDPDACCPRCDYGIADDDCAPIPVANVSLYAALGDGAQCRYDVTRHECDKRFLLRDGRVRECIGRKRARPVVTRDCEGIRKIITEDITQCIMRKPRAPIADLDLSPNRCNLRV